MNRERISENCVLTIDGNSKYYTYEKFRWLIEWLEYSEKLPQPEQYEFYGAVSKYGLYEIEPTLKGAVLDYFNVNVRPELDKQHKRLKEGKKL